MKKLALASGLALALTYSLAAATWSAPATPASLGPTTIEELRAEKLRRLIKRDARAQELITKADAKLAAMSKAAPDAPLITRLTAALNQIIMGGGSVAEARCRADLDLLEAFVRDHKEPSADELAPLQERYKKICDQLDDLILVKDLDRGLKVHDKLVRYTSLSLWDKDKISGELERLEGLLAAAADISYGSSELLDTYKNKKLAAVPRLVYTGSFPQEEIYLTQDRLSEAMVEAAGGSLALETVDHVIQTANGSLVDITESCNPNRGIPFSPPLSLWLKTKVLNGRIPAISFRLPERTAPSAFVIQDVIDGKLDDYIRRNMIAIGASKLPVLVGFLSDFDREAAAWSFGQDGRTPYYVFMDPKLKDLSADKLSDELKKRIDKGSFANAKTMVPELSNHYGDAQIPDGPERVRDAFKHFKKILSESGGDTLSFYSTVGSFFANKTAAKYSEQRAVGNQIWNKLDFYFPGEAVFDWIGINATGSDPTLDAKGPNIMEAIEPFMAEVRTSAWQATPVMLRGLAPSTSTTPFAEAPWITTVFQKIIPATFPNISMVFINIPENVTLWSGTSMSSFRTHVASNKFYKWPLRFKNLPAPASQQAGGQ